jgi:hypothetical protein
LREMIPRKGGFKVDFMYPRIIHKSLRDLPILSLGALRFFRNFLYPLRLILQHGQSSQFFVLCEPWTSGTNALHLRPHILASS